MINQTTGLLKVFRTLQAWWAPIMPLTNPNKIKGGRVGKKRNNSANGSRVILRTLMLRRPLIPVRQSHKLYDRGACTKTDVNIRGSHLFFLFPTNIDTTSKFLRIHVIRVSRDTLLGINLPTSPSGYPYQYPPRADRSACSYLLLLPKEGSGPNIKLLASDANSEPVFVAV